MTYAVIETESPHADSGRLVGLRISREAAIKLAKYRHKVVGKRVFVASKTNLRQPVFELAATKKEQDKAELVGKLMATLKKEKK